MSDNTLKTPLNQSLNRFAQQKAMEAIHATGKSLPCSVVSVESNGIVTVKFEVDSEPWTLPNVKVPILGSEYVRLPIRPGDKGMVIAADARLGGVSGLGGGVASLAKPANITALVFAWIGNTDWMGTDPMAVVIYSTPDCLLSVSPTGVTVTGPTGNLAVSGNLSAGNGVTCTFNTPSGQTIMVQDGIVTNMY